MLTLRNHFTLAGVLIQAAVLVLATPAITWAAYPDNRPDPRTSVLKMKGSELQQSIHEVLFEVAGLQALPRLSKAQIMELETAGMVGPDWAAPLAPNYFIGRAKSIVAGSNEIQHNVVAKGVLGL